MPRQTGIIRVWRRNRVAWHAPCVCPALVLLRKVVICSSWSESTMMRSLCFRVWPYVAASLFLSTAVVVPASGDTIDLRPVADTFVVNPPSNPPSPNLNGAQNFDFGGAGSRAVASSAAFSGTSGTGGAHGLFRSLLRFEHIFSGRRSGLRWDIAALRFQDHERWERCFQYRCPIGLFRCIASSTSDW